MIAISIVAFCLLIALVYCVFRLISTEKENSALKVKLENVESESSRNQEFRNQELANSEARFRNLANEILEDNSRRFREQNEQRMTEILTPLKENIDQFRKSVNDAYSSEARERFALDQRIREMIEINKSLGAEARQLTNALKGDTKIQGNWGEMILERILEKSGLKKGTHFTIQQTKDSSGSTLRDESGRNIRPDVVVYYPDGRCIVIDSKVSLVAYTDAVNSNDDSSREGALSRHIASVRENIRKLSSKNYNEYLGEHKADFVMMFIPNEGAYLAAMNSEPKLWEEAYDKRVVIVSPTHLISALRLVEQLWRQDDMKRNVINIAEEGGKMYDKLVGFTDCMIAIGKDLDRIKTTYDTAVNRLSTGKGNLVSHAEKMKKLGAKATKQIPYQLVKDSEDESDN